MLKWFRNLRIRRQLLIVFFVILSMAFLATAIGVAALLNTRASYSNLITTAQDFIAAHPEYTDNPSYLELENSYAEIDTLVVRMLWVQITFAILAAGASLMLILIAAKSISRPITKLVDISNDVADGNLNVRLDTSAMGEMTVLSVSLKRVIDIMNMFVNDLRTIDRAFRIDGDTTVRLDVSNYNGTYSEVATAVNDVLEYHVVSKREILECITKIVSGEHNAPLRKFPGHESRINDAVDDLRTSVRALEQLIKQKAEAESASNAKSSFLANMSHEIRTPMNAILGATEILMEDENLTPELKKSLLTIYNSGSLLLGIINDILDLSKIEAGKLDIVPGHYRIASMINDSAQLNALRIDNRVIDFELDINENTPTELIGDELRIKQILNNLLSNAFKYTDTGKVVLKVDFKPDGKKRTKNDGVAERITLILSVSDTGHGMTREQVEGLFVEYARYNQELRRTIEGTGLGLSITKRLIDLMGGKIHVESEPGVGTTFIVELPQERVNGDTLGRDVAESLRNFKRSFLTDRKRTHVNRSAMPYGKVLVVDDVEANLYVAEGMLKLYKMQVDIASSGQEAIDKVKAGNTYDIVFMDHMMPGMDGIEAVQIMRSTGYTSPVVALTANAVSGQSDMFLNSGFDDFIPKPIDSRHLNAVVNKFIRDTNIDDVIEAARWQTVLNQNAGNGASDDTPTGNTGRFLSETVQGLDIPRGLEKLGNDEESYSKTLHAYTDGIGSMLDFIEASGYDNIDEYRIKVHGIKGASYDIFADEIGDAAKALEMAAKSGDIDYITENNAPFIAAVRKLIDDITKMPSMSADADSAKPIREKPDADILSRLLKASEAFDMYGAEAAMREIEQYRYSSDDGLAVWLRENVDLAKFKIVSEKLREMKGE